MFSFPEKKKEKDQCFAYAVNILNNSSVEKL